QTWNLPGGRIVIHSFTGNEKCREVQFFEPACTRLDAPKRLWESGHARKCSVIQRSKPHVIVAKRMHIDVCTSRHIHAKTGIEEVIQRRPLMIPDVELLQRGAIGD